MGLQKNQLFIKRWDVGGLFINPQITLVRYIGYQQSLYEHLHWGSQQGSGGV